MHLSYTKSGSFVVNGEVKAAEEVNQENTGFFRSFQLLVPLSQKGSKTQQFINSCLSGIVFYAQNMFDPMSSSPEIGFFLLLSASLDCRGFAVLISEKNLSDADLSRLKKTTLKLSVLIIALTYEYIRSSLLLTSRSSYQFHYMRLYMFKMLFVINLLFSVEPQLLWLNKKQN